MSRLRQHILMLAAGAIWVLLVSPAPGPPQRAMGDENATAPALDNDIYVPDDRVQALFVLDLEDNEALVRVPRSEFVYVALLTRPGLVRSFRTEALAGLAKLRGSSELSEFLSELNAVDGDDPQKTAVLDEFGDLLDTFDAKQLTAARQRLLDMAIQGGHATKRRIGLAALMLADQSADQVWGMAAGSTESLREILGAVRFVHESKLRESLYPRIVELLDDRTDESVRHAAMGALITIPEHESETVAAIAPRLSEPADSAAAVSALRQISVSKIPAPQLAPLAESIVRYLQGIPVQQRTNDAAREAMSLVNDVLQRLMPDQARGMRERLASLAVRVVEIRTLKDQMAFDISHIAVEADRAVEIVLHNDDIQPHNLVIVKPGAMVEVGTYVDRNTTNPQFAAAQFVPPSESVLEATAMVPADGSVRLSFTAPDQPGIYPFICTYPGHWLKMFGRLYVVRNLDQYEQDPEGYIAANGLKIQDELLVDRPVIENYTFESLHDVLERVGEKRSFESAKKLFTVATCVACHRVGQEGGAVGPELSDISKRLKPLTILEDMADPSKRINEQYQTWTVFWNGRPITGIKKSEDEKSILLLTNPLISCEPVVIPKDELDDIEQDIRPAPKSTMPNGLLDRFTRNEILDLLAYVIAGGDEKHQFFSP